MKRVGAGRVLLMCLFAYPAIGAEEQLTVNETQVQASNRFVEEMYRLHERQLQKQAWKSTESSGGYRDYPDFYREVTYRDENGRLLSRVQWEKAQAARLHGIEVYVYDEKGELLRDYTAWFLPDARNAPRETTINLYMEEKGLRAWRQFDGSGLRVYERCTDGDKVVVELWDDAISRAEDDPKGVMSSDIYLKCFEKLPGAVASYQLID